jgi:hypothetical protein
MSQNKIAAKLVNILSELASVPKKGYNKHQSYHYMREVDVLEALKTELVKNKIIMLTSSKLVDLKEKEKSYLTTVETSHTFIDSESGEQLTITSVGSGWDTTDKGSAKAITSACKYALMKTFMISDEGQDIENDGETVQAPAVSTNRKSFSQNVTIKTDNKGNNQATVVVGGSVSPVTAPTKTVTNVSEALVTPTTIGVNPEIDQKNIPPWNRKKLATISTDTKTTFKTTRPTVTPVTEDPQF